MPSSEPRLSMGDGLVEVPVLSSGDSIGTQPVPLPLSPAPADVGSTEIQLHPPTIGKGTANRSHPKNGDALPPLLSLGDMLCEAPAWLFSAVLHMIVVLLLGLLLFPSDETDTLLLSFGPSDQLSDNLDSQDFSFPLDQPNLETPASPAAEVLPDIQDNSEMAMSLLPATPLSAEIHQETSAIRMGLSGREEGMKQALLEAYGGTAATQEAVRRGLRWLARNQEKNGAWDLAGRFADSTRSSNPEAATALALLAFQGAGYTPNGDRKEPFTTVVRRGWKYLLKRQDEHGNFFHKGAANAPLYTQAICTIAICELYGMTRSEQYRKQAQRAVDYCVKTQSSEGGWRYFPGSGSDLSVTGWFMMALQSARMAGLEVPSPTLSRISKYLDSVSSQGGSRYAYQSSDGATRTMTAEGLLCRQYLGWAHDDPRLQSGADFLIQHLPSWEQGEQNVYYWYYAAQVCHHMEGHHWRTWNRVMREEIPAHQVREGRERGSWDPAGDRWGSSGGRLYVTCLSLYSLEVYYRHLPIYQMELLRGGR